jgi:hypothetical protein
MCGNSRGFNGFSTETEAAGEPETGTTSLELPRIEPRRVMETRPSS